MKRADRVWRAWGTALMLLGAVTLASCSGSSGAAVASPTATLSSNATSTTSRTATATATPFPTYYSGPIPADPRAVCKPRGGPALTATMDRIVTFGASTVAPDEHIQQGELLPNTLQQKPQVLTASLNQGGISFSGATIAAVTFSTPSSGPISYICGVTVRIEAFQPIATPVPNATYPCRDYFYSQPGGFQGTGDCGGVPSPVGNSEVTFAAPSVGATATSSIIDRFAGTPLQPGQKPALPYTMDNTWVWLHVPAAGTYTFSFAFWQDGSGPSITAPPITETFSMGKIAHEWGGWQCLTPAMQAQLPPPPPAGQPPLQVICPGSPPTT